MSAAFVRLSRGVWSNASGFVVALVAGWQAYGAWRRRSRARAELATLDDRALKDLGFHRSEIDRMVAHGRRDVGVDRRRIRQPVSREQPEATQRSRAA